jgi:hypothetical protein
MKKLYDNIAKFPNEFDEIPRGRDGSTSQEAEPGHQLNEVSELECSRNGEAGAFQPGL